MSRTCGGMFGSHLGTMNTRYCGSKFGANGQAAIATSSGTAVCGNHFYKDEIIYLILYYNIKKK